MFRILVVEDDPILNKMVQAKLKQASYEVLAAFDGREALEVMDHEHVDLLICDIMMPNMNGYELIEAVRSSMPTLPILVMTAKSQIEDMEKGFQLGSDDYMVKPVNLKELVIRVGALLRRAQITNQRRLEIGDTLLDYEALTVEEGFPKHVQTLPPKEFYLLYKLLSQPNKIFTRLDLLDEIWGMDVDVDDRTIDSHIKKLRRRFEKNTDFEIVTIRGLGYKGIEGKGEES